MPPSGSFHGTFPPWVFVPTKHGNQLGSRKVPLVRHKVQADAMSSWQPQHTLSITSLGLEESPKSCSPWSGGNPKEHYSQNAELMLRSPVEDAEFIFWIINTWKRPVGKSTTLGNKKPRCSCRVSRREDNQDTRGCQEGFPRRERILRTTKEENSCSSCFGPRQEVQTGNTSSRL